MTRALQSVLAATLLLPMLPAQAALPGGISGPWFNPQQAGHGLSVDLVDGGDRAVVIWHVFTPEGEPLTLYIDGNVDARRISGETYAPRGMRFGNFDPATLDLPSWGEVSIDFSDCDHAQLRWTSNDPAYGQGHMAIERLANLDGAECSLPPENPLPAGLVHGEIIDVALRVLPAEGFVDKEGRLWGALRGPIPGTTWVGATAATALRAEPTLVSGSSVAVDTRALPAYAFWLPQYGYTEFGSGQWQVGGTLQGDFASDDPRGITRQYWRDDAELASSLLAPVDLAAVAGTYTFEERGQFVSFIRQLQIDADGRICIKRFFGCQFSGSLRAHEGDIGLLHFQLREPSRRDLSTYRGRAWLKQAADGRRELVLTGDNGLTGLVIIADEG